MHKAEEYGLTLEAIENVPIHFYDKAMLGLPGRDEQIEHYQTTIRNMGRAGIPILGYHFMPNSVWRTERIRAGTRRRRLHQIRHGRGRGTTAEASGVAASSPSRTSGRKRWP